LKETNITKDKAGMKINEVEEISDNVADIMNKLRPFLNTVFSKNLYE
jgi:hypothetical protein